MCPCGAYTGRCASTDAVGGLLCPSGRWQTLLMRILVGVACVNLAGVCGDLIWNGGAGGGHDRDHVISAWPLPEIERRRGAPMSVVFNWFDHFVFSRILCTLNDPNSLHFTVETLRIKVNPHFAKTISYMQPGLDNNTHQPAKWGDACNKVTPIATLSDWILYTVTELDINACVGTSRVFEGASHFSCLTGQHTWLKHLIGEAWTFQWEWFWFYYFWCKRRLIMDIDSLYVKQSRGEINCTQETYCGKKVVYIFITCHVQECIFPWKPCTFDIDLIQEFKRVYRPTVQYCQCWQFLLDLVNENSSKQSRTIAHLWVTQQCFVTERFDIFELLFLVWFSGPITKTGWLNQPSARFNASLIKTHSLPPTGGLLIFKSTFTLHFFQHFIFGYTKLI